MSDYSKDILMPLLCRYSFIRVKIYAIKRKQHKVHLETETRPQVAGREPDADNGGAE